MTHLGYKHATPVSSAAELTLDSMQSVEQTDSSTDRGSQDRSARRLSTAGRWLSKGAWALMDRGLFAVSNFILNVLLARWVSIEAYGAFAIAFALFLLLGAFYTALVTEPMLVFGPKRYIHRLDPYFGALLRLHTAYCACGFVVLVAIGVIAYAFGAAHLAKACVAFALAQPFILFLWLMRRACYLRSRPRPAAIAGFAYLLLMIVGMSVLNRIGLTVEGAVGVMAICAIPAGGGLWWSQFRGAHHRTIGATVFQRHLRYARWSIPARVTTFLYNRAYYFVLPFAAGAAAVATFRALMNLVMPMVIFNASLCVLLLPILAGKKNLLGQGKKMTVILGGLLTIPLLYLVFLSCFGEEVLHFLYGNKYTAQGPVLMVIGAIPIASMLCALAGTMARSRARSDITFMAASVAAVFTLLVGCPLAWIFGMNAVVPCMVVAYIIQVPVLLIPLLRNAKSENCSATAGESFPPSCERPLPL